MASFDPSDFPEPTAPGPRDPDPPPISDAPSLPHDLEAERTVLGYVMQFQPDEPPALTRDDFYSERHRIVWDSIASLYRKTLPPDAPLVHHDLRQRNLADRVDGLFLGELTDAASRATRLEHYVRILKRCALRRRAMNQAHELRSIAELDGTCETLARFVQDIPGRLTLDDERTRQIQVVDLYDPSIEPIHPSWLVRDFLPAEGLTMVWAPPGAGKTYSLLSLVHQLGCEPAATNLWGHPDLVVEHGIRKCLWVSVEERTGEIMTRGRRVAAGLDVQPDQGLIRHVYARGERRVWLEDLDELVRQEDPVDLVIVDSLTGLRPREIDGRIIKWDLDNDATSILSDALIDLYTRWRTSVVIVHHTGRDLARAATGPGYRGPTEWWQTVHAMWGLMPDRQQGEGALKVQIDKMRSGRLLPQFRTRMQFDQGRMWIEHEGAVEQPRDASDEQVLAYLRGCGMASQADVQRQTGLSRPTVRKALQNLIDEGLVEGAGFTGSGGSPVFRITTDGATDEAPE